MKYNDKNKPLVCMMTNSTCYKKSNIGVPVGVLWHSTAANNPRISRYVQPHETDDNYDEMIKLLGKNNNKNDWNHKYVEAGVNAWIGKLADGSVSTVQSLPWNMRPWGCGKGKYGSCNGKQKGDKFWIQFEICESDLNNKTYFDKVYKEACELTAYLCKMYHLNPYGTVSYHDVKVPVILCHADSHELGFGSNHGDVYHWFEKYGKTMDDVRDDVAKLMGKVSASTSNATATSKQNTSSSFSVGDEVRLVSGATYTSGKKIPAWVFESKLYVRQINGDNVVISTLKTGAVTGTVNKKYLTAYDDFKPYKVKVTVDKLNIRSGPGTQYKIVGSITDNGVYSIVNESNGFGKLKSGAGWISLGYCKKV